MTILSAATVKTFFEQGDKPTQSNFEDLIDTAVRPSLVAIATAAEADKVGVIAILGSTEATAYSHGTVGRQLLSSITTASASNHLGIATGGAIGSLLLAAIVTASAQGHLGGGAVGIALLESTGTASAQNKLGAGTVGKMLIEAITTASAANALNVGAGSTSYIIQVTGRTYVAIESTAFGASPTYVNTQVLVSTTPTSSASRFLIAVQINGNIRASDTGDTFKTIDFTLFSNGTDIAIAENTSALTSFDIIRVSAGIVQQGLTHSSKSISFGIQYIDSPSTVGTVTYRVKTRSVEGGVTWAMNTLSSAVGGYVKKGFSTITVTEMSS